MGTPLSQLYRDRPLYTVPEAAAYVGMPGQTLRHWVSGRSYRRRDGPAFSRPLIKPPGDSSSLLSFENLVEAHLLLTVRKAHGVTMANVRAALDYVEAHVAGPHPLLSLDFATDGKDLFIDQLGADPVNVSQGGLVGLHRLLEWRLHRIDRTTDGFPRRLFPLASGGSRRIALDPSIAFGRPVVVQRSVRVEAIFERFAAGESVPALAEDFELDVADVEEALAYYEPIAA